MNNALDSNTDTYYGVLKKTGRVTRQAVFRIFSLKRKSPNSSNWTIEYISPNHEQPESVEIVSVKHVKVVTLSYSDFNRAEALYAKADNLAVPLHLPRKLCNMSISCSILTIGKNKTRVSSLELLPIVIQHTSLLSLLMNMEEASHPQSQLDRFSNQPNLSLRGEESDFSPSVTDIRSNAGTPPRAIPLKEALEEGPGKKQNSTDAKPLLWATPSDKSASVFSHGNILHREGSEGSPTHGFKKTEKKEESLLASQRIAHFGIEPAEVPSPARGDKETPHPSLDATFPSESPPPSRGVRVPNEDSPPDQSSKRSIESDVECTFSSGFQMYNQMQFIRCRKIYWQNESFQHLFEEEQSPTSSRAYILLRYLLRVFHPYKLLILFLQFLVILAEKLSLKNLEIQIHFLMQSLRTSIQETKPETTRERIERLTKAISIPTIKELKIASTRRVRSELLYFLLSLLLISTYKIGAGVGPLLDQIELQVRQWLCGLVPSVFQSLFFPLSPQIIPVALLKIAKGSIECIILVILITFFIYITSVKLNFFDINERRKSLRLWHYFHTQFLAHRVPLMKILNFDDCEPIVIKNRRSSLFKSKKKAKNSVSLPPESKSLPPSLPPTTTDTEKKLWSNFVNNTYDDSSPLSRNNHCHPSSLFSNQPSPKAISWIQKVKSFFYRLFLSFTRYLQLFLQLFLLILFTVLEPPLQGNLSAQDEVDKLLSQLIESELRRLIIFSDSPALLTNKPPHSAELSIALSLFSSQMFALAGVCERILLNTQGEEDDKLLPPSFSQAVKDFGYEVAPKFADYARPLTTTARALSAIIWMTPRLKEAVQHHFPSNSEGERRVIEIFLMIEFLFVLDTTQLSSTISPIPPAPPQSPVISSPLLSSHLLSSPLFASSTSPDFVNTSILSLTRLVAFSWPWVAEHFNRKRLQPIKRNSLFTLLLNAIQFPTRPFLIHNFSPLPITSSSNTLSASSPQRNRGNHNRTLLFDIFTAAPFRFLCFSGFFSFKGSLALSIVVGPSTGITSFSMDFFHLKEEPAMLLSEVKERSDRAERESVVISPTRNPSSERVSTFSSTRSNDPSHDRSHKTDSSSLECELCFTNNQQKLMLSFDHLSILSPLFSLYCKLLSPLFWEVLNVSKWLRVLTLRKPITQHIKGKLLIRLFHLTGVPLTHQYLMHVSLSSSSRNEFFQVVSSSLQGEKILWKESVEISGLSSISRCQLKFDVYAKEGDALVHVGYVLFDDMNPIVRNAVTLFLNTNALPLTLTPVGNSFLRRAIHKRKKTAAPIPSRLNVQLSMSIQWIANF